MILATAGLYSGLPKKTMFSPRSAGRETRRSASRLWSTPADVNIRLKRKAPAASPHNGELMLGTWNNPSVLGLLRRCSSYQPRTSGDAGNMPGTGGSAVGYGRINVVGGVATTRRTIDPGLNSGPHARRITGGILLVSGLDIATHAVAPPPAKRPAPAATNRSRREYPVGTRCGAKGAWMHNATELSFKSNAGRRRQASGTR